MTGSQVRILFAAPVCAHGEIVEPDQSDLPVGQISELAVQPHLQKYFCFRLTQISSLSRAVLTHRGALRNVINAGAGCGGR
jgi:hypothetical protein